MNDESTKDLFYWGKSILKLVGILAPFITWIILRDSFVPLLIGLFSIGFIGWVVKHPTISFRYISDLIKKTGDERKQSLIFAMKRIFDFLIFLSMIVSMTEIALIRKQYFPEWYWYVPCMIIWLSSAGFFVHLLHERGDERAQELEIADRKARLINLRREEEEQAQYLEYMQRVQAEIDTAKHSQ